MRANVVASTKQVSSELAGEAVILDLDRGVYYGMEEVGARIWQLIQKPRRLDAICEALVEEYQVSRAECEQDVLALTEKLEEAGLVRVKHDDDE